MSNDADYRTQYSVDVRGKHGQLNGHVNGLEALDALVIALHGVWRVTATPLGEVPS